MSLVTMFFNGGHSYACFDTHNPADAEQYDSLRAAAEEFEWRVTGRDRRFPCVDDSAEAWVCKGPARGNIGADYPDWVISIGPRGGIRVQRV